MSGRLRLACLLLLASAASHATDPVLLPRDVPVTDDKETIKLAKRCGLGRYLAHAIALRSPVPTTFTPSDPQIGPVLDIAITSASTEGGFNDGRLVFLDIEGVLQNGGKQVASFRTSDHNDGAGIRSVSPCPVAREMLNIIAIDIANWLSAPRDAVSLKEERTRREYCLALAPKILERRKSEPHYSVKECQ